MQNVDPQEVAASLDQFTKDHIWIRVHHKELLEQYPDEWVVVYQEKVVGSGKDLNFLLEELRAQGFVTWKVVVSLIETNPLPLILRVA